MNANQTPIRTIRKGDIVALAERPDARGEVLETRYTRAKEHRCLVQWTQTEQFWISSDKLDLVAGDRNAGS